MALSCFLRKISTPVVRGPMLEILSRRLTSNCSVCSFRQHNQLMIAPNESKKWRSPLISDYAKQFSTSSTLQAQHSSHDHGKLWTLERILSGTLLPLVPVSLVFPSPILDTALALVMVLHTHFGLEAIVVDYIRPILFGEMASKIGLGLLYLFSIITLAGLLNLIYNDIGLANTIIAIWKK